VKVGLQANHGNKSAPREYRKSVNINHPELKAGQKLYLYDQCRVYSVKALQKIKQRAYLDLLEYRLKTGRSA
jgi:hypothetical protein